VLSRDVSDPARLKFARILPRTGAPALNAPSAGAVASVALPATEAAAPLPPGSDRPTAPVLDVV